MSRYAREHPDRPDLWFAPTIPRGMATIGKNVFANERKPMTYEPNVTRAEAKARIANLLERAPRAENELTFDELCEVGIYPPKNDPGEDRDEIAEANAWALCAELVAEVRAC